MIELPRERGPILMGEENSYPDDDLLLLRAAAEFRIAFKRFNDAKRELLRKGYTDQRIEDLAKIITEKDVEGEIALARFIEENL